MPGRTLRRGISLSSAAQGVGLRFGTTSLNSKNPFHAGSIALLAPDIVDAIPDGRQPAAMTLAVLIRPFAAGWREQSGDGFPGF